MAVNLGTAVGYLKLNIDGFISALSDAESKTNNFSNKLSSAGGLLIKGLTASLVGAGTAFVAATGYAVNFASEVDTALNSFQTSTGSAKEEMEDFEDVMLNIYNNNFGENLEDISNAMSSVKKEVEDISPENLQALTENALLLRDVFDYDVNEQIRAANMLMEQFEISGDEAFTLIAQGAQKGLDKNGDLLDTINEYSVQFKQLGFNAEEMFNSLENGAESGTFSVDKLGDTIKEFGIRVKDGSDTTISAFEDLGLNVDETAEKFAKGGNEAKEAFYEVTDALFDLEDPLKKNQVGVELFGTMWEDLGEEGVKALTNLEGEIDQTADTLDELNEVKYDDLESSFEGIKRAINTGLVLPLGKEALPAFKKFAESISKGTKEANGDIKKMSEVFADSLEIFVDEISDIIPDVIRGAGQIVSGLVKGLVRATPELTEAAVDLLSVVLEQIPMIAAEALIAAPQIVLGLAEGLLNGVVNMSEAAAALFDPLKYESKSIDEAFQENIQSVTAFTESIKNATPEVTNYDNILTDYGHTIGELDTIISQTEGAITEILANALQNQEDLRQQDLDNIRRYTQELYEAQIEKIQAYREQQNAVLLQMLNEKNEIQQEDAVQYLANAKAALDNSNKATEEAYQQRLVLIENTYKASDDMTEEQYQQQRDEAREFYESQLTENESYYSQLVEKISGYTNKWLDNDRMKWWQLSEQMWYWETTTEDGYNKLIQSTDAWIGKFGWAKDDFKFALSEMDLDTANTFLSMVANVKSSGGELDIVSQDTVRSMLETFDNLPPELDAVGKDALLSMIAGLEEYIPELEDTTDLTANDIVDILRDEWGLDDSTPVFTSAGNSAMEDLQDGVESKEDDLNDVASRLSSGMSDIMDDSDSFYTAGSNSSQGYINGFNSNESQLQTIASNMASGALTAMKTVLGIASPSKEFGKLGMFSAQGYINNFEDEMEDGQKVIIDLSQLMLSQFFAQAKKFNSDIQRYKFLSGMFDVSSDYYSFAYSGKKINRNDNSGNEPQQISGDTFNFYSPKPIDEIEAARQLKKVKQDIAEGFVY